MRWYKSLAQIYQLNGKIKSHGKSKGGNSGSFAPKAANKCTQKKKIEGNSCQQTLCQQLQEMWKFFRGKESDIDQKHGPTIQKERNK